MPGIDECLLEAMRLPGARGAAVVDWTSGLALGTVGESPDGDHEATAAETAELARLAAEHRAFAPGPDGVADWSGGGAEHRRSRTSSSPTATATTSCASSRRPSTAACSCICGWPARTATSRWPGIRLGEMAERLVLG